MFLCSLRFDHDLQKLSEQTREERAMKEKLYREKDELNAEKFAVEQKFKVFSTVLKPLALLKQFLNFHLLVFRTCRLISTSKAKKFDVSMPTSSK